MIEEWEELVWRLTVEDGSGIGVNEGYRVLVRNVTFFAAGRTQQRNKANRSDIQRYIVHGVELINWENRCISEYDINYCGA